MRMRVKGPRKGKGKKKESKNEVVYTNRKGIMNGREMQIMQSVIREKQAVYLRVSLPEDGQSPRKYSSPNDPFPHDYVL